MQVKRPVVCLGLLIFFSAANAIFGVRGGRPSRPRTEVVDDWVKENYGAILHNVFPERLDLLPFPRRVKWVSVVRIEEPFLLSEYWVSVSKEYDGAVRASIKMAHGGSLARQIKELREAHPDATQETISKMVQVDNYEITDKEVPKLKNLANSLERMRISSIMPDSMGSDLFGYHYWTESQYGQQMSAQLVGFGRDAKKQPHPLVEWAEQVRALTTSYIARRPVRPSGSYFRKVRNRL